MVGGLLREARALKPREAWRDILRGFEENDLLTYASAIAFQVAFALIPLALLGLGLLGAFGLTNVWSSDVAPTLKEGASHDVFAVVDHTVRRVLSHQQLFWATAGALIATWKVSGAMRATMQVLSRIYHVPDHRPFWTRIFLSIWLSGLVTVLLLLAVAATRAVPTLLGNGALAALAGWIVAAALMAATVGAIVRFAPACERPLRWVTFGTLLVIAGWVLGSLVFAWYVTDVADYGSVFGSLAVVMVTYGYIYLSAVVFLTGLQLDSLIRREVEDFGEEPQSSTSSAAACTVPLSPDTSSVVTIDSRQASRS
jgi:membrane protein